MSVGGQSEKPTVFVSYSHKDEKWLDSILPQLKAAQRYGNFEVWSDLDIREGERWYLRVKEILSKTRFAVCLVSADFLSSSFCMDEEIPFFLQKARRGECEILPVLIKPCPWKKHPWLEELQMYTANGKPLAGVSGNTRDQVFTWLADHVFEASQPGYVPPPPPPPEWDAPEKEDISHLPETGELLFGRRDEQNLLNDSWNDPKTNIIVFKAHGGVGKSTLVRVWTERMRRDNYREVEYVYAWSFYSQGTRERVTSADQFINAALQFFGDPDPAKGSPWDKGERLAELVAAQRTLLLLDGMEPLQSGHDFDLGGIKDPALKTLLEALAERNPGLCVISTREEVTDLQQPEYENAVKHIDLEHVSTVAGRALLRTAGVTGPDERLEAAVDDLGRHALALNLLAAYLAKWHGGSIEGVADVPELLDVGPKEGRHAQRVMAAIEKRLGQGPGHGPEVEWLRVLGLFDAPAEQGPLKAVLAKPAIRGLTDRLAGLSKHGREEAVERLRDLKLVAEESHHVPPRLDCHPLVRERFGGSLKQERPQAWREGNRRLYEYCQAQQKEEATELRELEPLFLAVSYGRKAEKLIEALDEVFFGRINGNDNPSPGGDHYRERYENHRLRDKLGGLSTDCALLQPFFDRDWQLPAAERRPSKGTEADALCSIGLDLRMLGKLDAAVPPLERALDLAKVCRVDGGCDDDRATNYGRHLAQLYLTKGDVEAAVGAGKEASEYGARGGSTSQRLQAIVAYADALHQHGWPKAARKQFVEAEKIGSGTLLSHHKSNRVSWLEGWSGGSWESRPSNTCKMGVFSKPGIHLTQVTPTSCSWAHSVLASQSATIERYGVGSTAMACCTRR